MEYPNNRKAIYTVSIRPQYLQAVSGEIKGIPDRLVQAQAVNTFGDLPQTVLSRRLDLTPDWQAELLKLSSNSQHLVAEHSNHKMNVDQREVVIAAIVEMVEQIRR